MEEQSHHFVRLPTIKSADVCLERGFNVSQVVSYEYREHGADGTPLISLTISGGAKIDYHAEDAKRIFVAIRGKW